MSILAISAQVYADVSLGIEVPAEFFTPPPKVDSQVVILKTRDQPLIPRELEKEFFRVVKAGFSEKRKKLRSSLSGGLGTDKKQTESMFSTLGIDLDLRAQDLDIEQWVEITKARK